MKQVYTGGDHTTQFNITSDSFRLFDEVSALLHAAFDGRYPSPGTGDIIIRGEDLLLLKAALVQELEQRVNSMKEREDPNTGIDLMGRHVRLNTRDQEHNTIYVFNFLAEVADREYEQGGSLFLYNISALDSLNTYIMKVFRSAAAAIAIKEALGAFRSKYPQFAALEDAAFTERVMLLLAEGFLERNAGQGEALFRCTGKTLALKII